MPTINPFARPVYLMAKPAGSLCNLRCKYCYYLEKSKLYDNNEKHIMSDQLLEKFIKDYIEAQRQLHTDQRNYAHRRMVQILP